MWDERDGFLVSLVVICGVPITTIPQPQLIAGAKLSEIYSEAGIKPLDFVIIHRPKSPPCTHRAIFIPRWMCFLSYIIAQAQGRDFLFWEQISVFQTLVKSEKQSSEFLPWSQSVCLEWCMWLQSQCLFLNFHYYVMFLMPQSNPLSTFSTIWCVHQ